MTRRRVITFDVYGTLTQWDETVHAVMRELITAHGRPDADIRLAANAFEAESRRLQTVGAFRSYREILRQSLVPAFAIAGLQPNEQDEATLLDRLSRIPAYPEVAAVLRRLSAEYRLAPISNTDDSLLAGTLEQFGNVFTGFITAERARAYKPNPGLFRYAIEQLEVDIDDVIHVAQGPFSDLAVCTALGIRVVWVNRTGMALQEGLKPSAVVAELAEVPGAIVAM